MTRVLLVDDLAIFREPLAAVLRQHGFEVEVAANGSEALQQARAHHPDIVLLDAAMPVMDGVVCAQHMRNDPQLREIPIIMLTAISDRDVIANAARAGVRNYMLKSQFTTEELLARIRKTLRTAPADLVSEDSAPPSSEPPPAASPELTVETPPVGELSGKQLLATIREHMEVRSIKPVLQHVLALTRSSHSSFDEIAAAIRQDPALAMKVMKVANSSYYRTGNPATTLRDAEHRIGLSGIRNVTTAILAIEEFSEVTAAGLVPQRFWEHSLATAVLGERIAALAKTPQSEDLFLAGLLHDMGRLVLSDVLGKQYASLLGDMRNQDKCLDQFERERLQLSHADVTREILTLWKMPDHVIEAASLHHLPIDAVQRKARSPRTVLSLMLANRLSHALLLGDSGSEAVYPIRKLTRMLGLEDHEIRTLANQAVESTLDATCFYSMQSITRPLDPLASAIGGCDASAPRVFVPDPSALLLDAPLMMFEQLGWLANDDPSVAIIGGDTGRQLRNQLDACDAVAQEHGHAIPLVWFSTPQFEAWDHGDLHVEHLVLPCRHTRITEAVRTASNATLAQ